MEALVTRLTQALAYNWYELGLTGRTADIHPVRATCSTWCSSPGWCRAFAGPFDIRSRFSSQASFKSFGRDAPLASSLHLRMELLRTRYARSISETLRVSDPFSAQSARLTAGLGHRMTGSYRSAAAAGAATLSPCAGTRQ